MTFNFNKYFEEMIEEKSVNTVMIFGHRNPDGDAAGSVLGLAHYLKTVYPEIKIIPHIGKGIDKGPAVLIERDEIFTPLSEPQKPEEAYMVITCDTATKARIAGGEFFDGAEGTMVIDHHVSNEGYGDINYINPDAEANAENLALILDWDRYKAALKENYHPNAIDYLYLGLVHDTSCFERATMDTMKAAMTLQELGADHKATVETTHMMKLKDLENEVRLLKRTKTALDGQVAYVKIGREECDTYGMDYEDIHPISGILRDCRDVKMAFTMYEEKKDVWRCSFRSKGWVDVNWVVSGFGGGGHAKAAGLTLLCDNPDELLEKIIERVKMSKEN